MENSSSESRTSCTDDSIKSMARIKEYPVIKDSFSKASEYYNWIKGQSSALSSTLNWTGNIVTNAIHKVEPIASSQLESLDKYACSKLDNLESKYPIVKEPSENVIKSSSEYYESNIKPKVDSAKTYATTTSYRITTQTMELLSNTAHNFVGKYMNSSPPTDSTDNTATITDEQTGDFNKAVKEIEIIQQYTMTNVGTLTSLLSAIYNKTVTNNEEWLHKYYDEFRSELDSKDESHSAKTDTNSKLMHLAQQLSNKLRVSVRAMSTVCYNHLSLEYREKLDLVFAKTEQLYGAMNMSTYDTVRDQISMDNVHWIGQTALGIINNAKEVVVQKYRDNTGTDAIVDRDNGKMCAEDSADVKS